MRGLVIVALGAILIWIGLSSGGGSTDASTGDTSTGDVPGGTRAEVHSESYDPDRDAGSTAARVSHDAAEAVSDWQPEAAAPAAVAPAPEVELAPVVDQYDHAPADAENDPPEVAFGDPTSDFDPTLDLDPEVGFGGAPSERTRLATILLEAWISGEPTNLSTYIIEGEGAELPAARQQLVAGFWEALIGDVDAARKRLDAIRGHDGVTSTQVALLSTALDPPGQRAIPRAATAGRTDPLALSMQMVLLGDEARSLLDARDYGRSAVAWSDLVQREIAAPWPPHRAALLEWGRSLAQAQSNHRFAKSGNWPSVDVTVRGGDSLTAIRKRVLRNRPDLRICTGLIDAANGLGGAYLQANDVLRVPTDRVNAIVDLDARIVLYRHGDEVVQLWECGIGKAEHETPIGVFEIGDKLKKPALSTKGLPYGHKDNPLGSRWLALLRDGQKTTYGIHGTQDPTGVGGAVSLGCVRMRNEDVNELFEIMPMGSEVVIQR